MENRRVETDPRRSIGAILQRKPLADCTNTIPRSSQQPSSSVKYANPSLTSSLKRLVDQTTLKEKTNDVHTTDVASTSIAKNVKPVTRRMSADLSSPRRVVQTTLKEKINDVNNSDAASKSASRSLATNTRPVTRRISAHLDSPASAPAPIRTQNLLSDQGVSEKEFDAPYSVYTVRRKASGKRKKKDTASSSAVARLRLDLTSSSGKKSHKANENRPKKVAPKKKQRTVKHEDDNQLHGVSREYIEQQKAYFAEVDAFELQEEEVTSSSDLD